MNDSSRKKPGSTPERLAAGSLVVVGVLVAAMLSASATRSARSGPGEKPAGKIVPIFSETTAAANPSGLVLNADRRKVLGWISGNTDFTGGEVTVQAGGRTETVIVQRGNTFTWYYAAPKDKDLEATYTVGKWTRTVPLEREEARPPSVFFVVDRTAYRPGQTLHFVAFLRRLGAAGRFEPLTGQQVDVEIRSVKKKTVAAKLRLQSDDFGRIAGQYAFVPQDALDEYTVSIPGYKGEARLKLAQFRKAKVRLEIAGRTEGGKLRLTFEGRDFLGKPVPAERVQFTARVVSRGRARKPWSLKAEDFAYHEEGIHGLPGADDLTAEQLLLLSAEGSALGVLWQANSPAVLAEITGEVKLDGKSSGQYTIDLKGEWAPARHAVWVQAVLIDQNGREQRAAKRIELNRDAGHAKAIRLALPKRTYFSNEPIRLSVDAPGAKGVTVVAMKLTAQPQPVHYGRYYPVRNSAAAYPYRQLRRGSALALSRRRRPAWTTYQPVKAFQETLVTAVVVTDGVATLKLAEPGAYKLVAIGGPAAGPAVREEVGCVVRDKEGFPSLLLKLDKSEFAAGENLTGQIHSRFRDATLLLTLRDSSGIRLWRTIRTTGSVAALKERLPAGLAYGCTVRAYYVDKAGRTHAAQKNVRVVPVDRMLTVRTEMKEVCQPGEEAKITVRVNRDEPVDLAVSVYDQSLLGIAPDRSVNVRNFYLADERAFDRADLDLLCERLGSTTVEELLPRITEHIKKHPNTPGSAALQEVLRRYKQRRLYEYQISALLNFLGIRTRVISNGYNWHCQINPAKGAENRLADLIRQRYATHYRLAFRAYDELMVVGVADTRTARLIRVAYPQAYPAQARQLYGNRRLATRGDAHFSTSANAAWSISGQSFISHMPVPGAGGAPAFLAPPGGDGSIMVRRNFSDSAFWNGRVRTNDRGQATVAFKLPDSLTNWRVVVTAVTKDMHVGQAAGSFRTYKPIMVWPMIPQNFTQGDRIRIFARVHNRTDKSRHIRVALAVKNGDVLGPKDATVLVAPKGSRTVYWTFRPGEPGFTQVLMTAACDAGSDASLKRLPVVPACAVESTIARSGFCQGKVEIDVPNDALLDRARLEVTLTPSLLADMVDTLDYLVGYPHGCVEQTMSRFLPAIKVAGILKSAGIRHKPLEAKLPKCVAGGIKRLLQLQRPDGGWGWNGNGRTHEMMTPYALYGLLEAEKAGYTIGNETAINRGLDRLRKFINAMGPKQAADRTYCIYVYAHRRKIEAPWWKFIDAQLDGRKLSDYAMALALELAVRDNKKALARRLAGELHTTAKRVGTDAHWTTARFSRWGNDPCEITAAVLKALVAHDAEEKLIPGMLGYFARTKRGNRWNSTKATAMVLFAMCDFLARKGHQFHKQADVVFAVNDGKCRQSLLTGGLVKKIVIGGKELRHGRNTVRFDRATPGTMCRLVFRYRKFGTEAPASANGIDVRRQFHLLDRKGQRIRTIRPGETIPRGSYIESLVTASIVGGGNMRYCLVTNNKPSGSEIVPVADKRFNQSSTAYVLREDQSAAVLYHHESAGHSLTDRSILYAELAGEFIVPPATVELMYRADVHGHSGTFRFQVTDDAKKSG